MILTHCGKSPMIDPTAYVAPNATVCGDVRIGPQCLGARAGPVPIGGSRTAVRLFAGSFRLLRQDLF